MLRLAAAVALAAGAVLAALPAAAQEPVTIGLVLPGEGEAGGLAAEARAAAEAAVADANRDGGYRGRPFALRVVSEDGLWGQGLGRVVTLSFDEPVRGVIGGLDGRSAHLIQQVIIKARLPFLTPWASDPTLSRGMIPWFFQVVPDDRQQAAVIVADARGLVIVADTSYDDRQFAAAVEAAAHAADATVRRIDAAAGPAAVAELLSRVTADRGEQDGSGVVLATGGEDGARILDRLAALPRPPTVYVPLRLARGAMAEAAAGYPGRVLAPAVGAGGGLPGMDAGEPAGTPVARHTREAVDALVSAIRSAGLDPWLIRDALADAAARDDGSPAFDDTGRRLAPVRLVEINRLVSGPSG